LVFAEKSLLFVKLAERQRECEGERARGRQGERE
jgi:hypothetical protein